MAMEPIGDQLNIDTPELVAIEMPLAGIGSRFIAILVDYLILGAAFLVLILLAAILLPALQLLRRAFRPTGPSASLFSSSFSCSGDTSRSLRPSRTGARRASAWPGSASSISRAAASALSSRWPATWCASSTILPGFYAVGVVAIFVSQRNQRLGDMVAGTLVVRDREIESPHWSESTSRTFTAPVFAAAVTESSMAALAPHLRVALPAPALAKLSVSDLEVLEGFFARRLDMDLATRGALAGRIASALSAKSGLAIPPIRASRPFSKPSRINYASWGA